MKVASIHPRCELSVRSGRRVWLRLLGIALLVALLAACSSVEGPPDDEDNGFDPPLDRLLGDSGDPAAEAIPELDFIARAEDYSDDHPELSGVFISFNTLILSFKLDTTVQEANEVLSEINAEIVGGIPGIADDVEGILFLRVPTTSHEEMIALLANLRANDEVENAAQDALLEESVIPAPNGGNPADWTWTLTPEGGNYGLELIRTPQMWNLNDAVERSGHTTVTGVFDTGFADSHEDLNYLENQTPGNAAEHGTHVAGTIGATFDNGVGVDGVNPFAQLVVSALGGTTGRSVFERRTSFGKAFLTGYNNLIGGRGDVRVVNISMGYNWDPAGVDQNNNTTAQELVAEQGALFRTLQIILSRTVDLPLVVPAAGNDSSNGNGFGTQAARWGSPFNYAGLVLDPPNLDDVSNIIVVESVARDIGGEGDATRSNFSNIGGDISAPGSSIGSTVLSNGYNSMSGTSMAAPHVTGLISYLYSVDPALTHAQVRELLFANSVPVGGGASNRIDAYATVLDIDRIRGNDRVRGQVLDVTNNGAFTEDDVQDHLDAFAQFEGLSSFDPTCSVPLDGAADCPIYSRFDLNGDGLPGGRGSARFDLDRDGTYDNISVSIDGNDVDFNQTSLSDLEILCYYAYSSLYSGSVTTRTALLGSSCDPVSVTLPPSGPVTVPVTVSLPDPTEGEVGADVVFNVDLSSSFADDIATFQARAFEIVEALEESASDVRVGLTSFVDAPCQGFGSASNGDYGHRLDLALTSDVASFKSKLDGLRTHDGGDWPESQLESMYQTMTGAGHEVRQGTPCDIVADIEPSSVGWTNDRLRFLLNSTDADFHRPGVLYPYPSSVTDVIDTAISTGTRISFLDSGGATDAVKNNIANATGGTVFQLRGDSAEVVDAVREAIRTALNSVTVKLEPSGDDAGFVDSVNPLEFTGVDLTTTRGVTFDVTFINTVTPGPDPQVFRFELLITVDEAIIERRPVVITVPAS